MASIQAVRCISLPACRCRPYPPLPMSDRQHSVGAEAAGGERSSGERLPLRISVKWVRGGNEGGEVREGCGWERWEGWAGDVEGGMGEVWKVPYLEAEEGVGGVQCKWMRLEV